MGWGVRRGIGLVEVLFVLLVVGLLVAAAIPRFVYSSDAKAEECRANVALINAKLDNHLAAHGLKKPADGEEFLRLLTTDKDCFPNGLPKCPYGRPYQYDPDSGQVTVHRH